jgi:23S rRNA (cytidine1920-2'-O)/16S rRNA (cytidine1409-2'-O)-methyltransferase
VDRLPEPPALVTIDASFISLRILLPVVRGWFGAQRGRVVALIKPQFEAGKEAVDRGEGVIHDPRIHRQVLEEVLAFAQAEGYTVGGLVKSILKGPKGNAEFLVDLIVGSEVQNSSFAGLIDQVMKES